MPSTFFKSTALIATLASLFSKVAAHGFVNGASVGGTWYQGFDETTWENKANGSPILITSYLVPLYDVWSSCVFLLHFSFISLTFILATVKSLVA